MTDILTFFWSFLSNFMFVPEIIILGLNFFFDKFKVPAALLSGTLVASGVLQISDIASYKLPDASINFCLLILGASVGCRFANKTFKEGIKAPKFDTDQYEKIGDNKLYTIFNHA